MTGSELFKFLDLVKEFEQKAKELKEKQMEGETGAGAKAHAYQDAAKKVNDLLHVLNP
jgi:hypothetical protein